MRDKLRQDSFGMGTFLGIVLPLVVFGILWGIIKIIGLIAGIAELVRVDKIILLSICVNLFTLRYYLLKLKMDKTGRGILAVTFIFGLLFFILEIYIFKVI